MTYDDRYQFQSWPVKVWRSRYVPLVPFVAVWRYARCRLALWWCGYTETRAVIEALKRAIKEPRKVWLESDTDEPTGDPLTLEQVDMATRNSYRESISFRFAWQMAWADCTMVRKHWYKMDDLREVVM